MVLLSAHYPDESGFRNHSRRRYYSNLRKLPSARRLFLVRRPQQSMASCVQPAACHDARHLRVRQYAQPGRRELRAGASPSASPNRPRPGNADWPRLSNYFQSLRANGRNEPDPIPRRAQPAAEASLFVLKMNRAASDRLILSPPADP